MSNVCVWSRDSRFVPGTNVSVPTHFFAVLTSCRDAALPVGGCVGELQAASFLLPHRPDNSESCKVRPALCLGTTLRGLWRKCRVSAGKVTNRTQKNPKEPNRTQKNPNEPKSYQQNPKEPQRTHKLTTEPKITQKLPKVTNRIPKNPKEPQRNQQNPKEPKRTPKLPTEPKRTPKNPKVTKRTPKLPTEPERT